MDSSPSPSPPPQSPRSPVSVSSTSSDSPTSLSDLAEKRAHLQALAKTPANEGDTYFLVPAQFLHDALNAEVTSFEELKQALGPLDCSSIVSNNGSLYPESSEPVSSYNVPPPLFHQLVDWFGQVGPTVSRNVVVNPLTGATEVERYPPYFTVHTLSKATRYHGVATGFTLSQTKTFGDLVNAVQSHVFKGKHAVFRVWFIDCANIEEYPNSISIATFIDTTKKSLVLPSILSATLKSQGVGPAPRLHLLVESQDRSSQSFPLDTYLASYNDDSLNVAQSLTKGGNFGLSNLGNTCYMNSALQCLLHIPEINYYFFFDVFEKELNKSNPLGNNGDVATVFGALLHKLFGLQTSSAVSPRDFKHTIGRYSSLFQGYQQQDSQEFLSWLLDALHEDLNRIYNKPYCEKPELKDEDVGNAQAIKELSDLCWHQHKLRNDSVIVDLFTGMYQSTLVCPDCNKTSITFDPFNDLTLPLPISKKWYHTFTIVDLSGRSAVPVQKLEVELNKNSNYDELLKYLSSFLEVPPNHLFLFEIFRNFFYRDFQESYGRVKFFPISEVITDTDEVAVYIIPHDPEADIVVPVLNSVPDSDRSYNMIEPFGLPLFVVLQKGTDTISFGKIRRKLEQCVKKLTKLDIEAQYNQLKENSSEYFKAGDFPLLKNETEISDIVDSSGYDSDISLANPTVSGSYGFEIKFYADSRRGVEGVAQIPHTRPQFSNLPALALQLPELKRNYYHYPEYSSQLDREIEEMTTQVEQNLSETFDQEKSNESPSTTTPSDDLKDLDYVLVDEYEPPVQKSVSSSVAHLLDDDTESETLGNVGLLFDSVHKLGPPSCTDSQSVQNSPEADHRVNNHPELVYSGVTLVCEWDPEIHARFFKNDDVQTWTQPQSIPNPALEESRAQMERQSKNSISLYDCLSSFNTPEVLGDQDLWYCPRCKEHKQATKTIQVWSTGDILTIHLKRFQSARSFSDKIDTTVDFPIEGLDMTPYVASLKTSEVDGDAPFEPQLNLIYDLVAVDNHYGGLGGGHYTASAKNFRDGKWYYFNDSRVTPINDPTECVTGAAYLLFYRKRSAKLAGGDNVEQLISKGRVEFEQKMGEAKARVLHLKTQCDAYAGEKERERKEREEKEREEREKEEKEREDKSDEKEVDDAKTNSDPSDSALAPEFDSTNKKSRSPVNEYEMKFESYKDEFNKRKQRLISKDVHSNRSVHIPSASHIESSSDLESSKASEGN